jgi:lactate permease
MLWTLDAPAAPTALVAALSVSEDLPPLTPARWLVALAPIAILFVLVVRGRTKTTRSAAIAAGATCTAAVICFGADAGLVAVGAGKGAWAGVWILYVIWPALLMYQLAKWAGLDRVGTQLAGILPTPTENLLIVAWVLPSFVQGVAGFGTPIAVAAPLLVAMGRSRRDAVALPLIGYHWSVTFGSMGSSFYMGALTAGLTGRELDAYGLKAACILAVNCVVAGVLVCLMTGGGRRALREAATMLVVTGGAMGATLILVAQVEPSVASVSAGAAGLVTVPVLRVLRRGRALAPAIPPGATEPAAAAARAPTAVTTRPTAAPEQPDLPAPADAEGPYDWAWTRILLPYGILLALVLPVFLIPASREFAREHLLVGPSFGATSTSYGLVNAAVDRHSPIALLGHPGTYLLVAALLGALAYRRAGLLAGSDLGGVTRAWVTQARKASLSVVLLAGLAGVMVESGMIRILADGVVAATGSAFPALSAILGATGSFTTGSTTTSNALLAALQGEVAGLVHVAPSTLVAAQTAGGNVGNALAPVVVLVGTGAVGGGHDEVGAVVRAVVRPAAVLAAVVTAITAAMVWL